VRFVKAESTLQRSQDSATPHRLNQIRGPKTPNRRN